MADPFVHADALGPCRILHLYEPRSKLRATLVVDNVAAGPAIGGLRMARDVSTAECFRLARAMTLKNAVAGLRHGGAKSVLYGDPGMGPERKEALIRAFAAGIAGETAYIPGPDMGTNETCMAWIRDEIGRAAGLPRSLGGLPLDELGATAWGLLAAARVAGRRIDLPLEGARVVVQGFGAVGRHAARFFVEAGAVLVGAADSGGTISAPDGLDLGALTALKASGRSVADHGGGERLGADAAVGIDCDIWIPAARPDVVDERNERELRARLVLEGANIPITEAAERRLHARGVTVVPDFVANAGGVITAAFEYQGATETAAFDAIEEKVARNTDEVLARAAEAGTTPREAGLAMARERVTEAMSYRRHAAY
jgi:glutamate dehydrogenase (NAD(P)+)